MERLSEKKAHKGMGMRKSGESTESQEKLSFFYDNFFLVFFFFTKKNCEGKKARGGEKRGKGGGAEDGKSKQKTSEQSFTTKILAVMSFRI